MRVLKDFLPMRFFSFALVLVTAVLVSCKEDEQVYFEEETIVQNAGLGQAEAYDALEVAYFIEVQFLLNPGYTSISDRFRCSTYVNNEATKTITMTFPAETCTAGVSAYPYGRIRTGKLLVQYETEVGDTLSGRTITFEDYYVSGKKLEGTVSMTSITRDTTDHHLRAVCTFDGFKVSFENGSSVTYYGKQLRVWTSGEDDVSPINNTYTVTTLTDSLDIAGPVTRTFKAAVTSSLRLNFSCATQGNLAVSSGTVQVSDIDGMGNAARSVNFGSGTCDKSVTVTTSRRTYSTSVN